MNSHQSSFDEIRCPSCGEKIPVTEVIYHQIAEQARAELKSESAEQQALLSEKIRSLQLREAELDIGSSLQSIAALTDGTENRSADPTKGD